MKTFWFITVLIIVVVGGLAFAIWNRHLPASSTGTLSAVTGADWLEGNRVAKTVLIEYSDFQCPACGAYFPILQQLRRDLGPQMAFVYRHFPLPQHQNAKLAAYAAEAAGRQGKFFEMHDMIFEHQSDWSEQSNARDIFIGYADSLHIDHARFVTDLDSQGIKDKVDNDFNGGVAAGVNSTPTFFLNGQKITNPRSYDEFKNLITGNGNAAGK